MTDEKKETPKEEPKTDPKVGDVPDTWEDVFKHERFTQLNERAKKAESELATFQDEQKKRAEERKTAADAKKTELEKLTDRLGTLETQLTTEHQQRIRLEVATRKGIPAEMVGRLQGNTIEELEADADALAEFLKPAISPGVPPAGKGKKKPALNIENLTPEEIRKRLPELQEKIAKGEL